MNIRPFEIGLIVIFAISALGGLIYMSNFTGTQDAKLKIYGESVVIWGTLDEEPINNFINELSTSDKALEVVDYVQKDEETFQDDLLNAIADGQSPDLVILPHTLLVTYRSKLRIIPSETITERTFKDTYIDGAEIFMRPDGVYGFPFAVDPLVMYWNRDIFSSGGLSTPPKTWESLMSESVSALVKQDNDHKITQSAVAFGEYDNVRHAKDVIAMLLLQAGTSIVDENNDGYRVTLAQNAEGALPPGESVLSFYAQFASPSRELYSWNRSKSLDRSEFTGGNLALYFGPGSERKSIDRENANLNYDIAVVPQGGGSAVRRNYGTFYAFTIPNGSENPLGAMKVALLFSNKENAKKLSEFFDFAPVMRSLYEGSTGDAFSDVIYRSGLIARGWLDPSPLESDDVFRSMIEEMNKGQVRTKSIILDTVQELENLF